MYLTIKLHSIQVCKQIVNMMGSELFLLIYGVLLSTVWVNGFCIIETDKYSSITMENFLSLCIQFRIQ